MARVFLLRQLHHARLAVDCRELGRCLGESFLDHAGLLLIVC
jgi:hypothetical protein